MKIAITTRFANYPGGVETVTSQLKEVLQSQGHHVEIFSWDLFSNTLWLKAKRYLLGEERVFASLVAHKLACYDMVICNGEFGYNISHPRAICIFHGSYRGYVDHVGAYMPFRQKRLFERKAKVQVLAAAGKEVVAVSHFIRKILEKEGITVHSVLENCVDAELFCPMDTIDKPKNALFVGSSDYYGKGFDILKKIAQEGVLIDCMTKEKPPQPLQWVRQESYCTMPSVYRRYRFFLFPSRFEGLSMAPLEAMACGVPAVISSVGLGEKLSYYIPEFVVDSENPLEYIEALHRIERNYAFYCQKARQYVTENHPLSLFRSRWTSLVKERKV